MELETENSGVFPDISQLHSEDLSALRRCWEFASVVQFTRLFSSVLKIRPFAADLLERALVQPVNHNTFISELCYKLLSNHPEQNPSEEMQTWHERLLRWVNANWSVFFDANPLEKQNFMDALPVTRVSSSLSRQQCFCGPASKWLAGGSPIDSWGLACTFAGQGAVCAVRRPHL